jgi:hypothetical protein
VNPFCLNHDALDLVEADVIGPSIVELGRARRGMVPIAAAFSSVPPFLNRQ